MENLEDLKLRRNSGRIKALSIFRRYHRRSCMPPLVFSCLQPFCSSYPFAWSDVPNPTLYSFLGSVEVERLCFSIKYLYDILTNANVVKKKIPPLLCCNRTDKLTAHTNELIKKQMEKEIGKLRASRSAVSTADIANDFTIGIEGEVFSFSHCCNKVTVAEASGLNGETLQVQDFIREYIKP